MIKITYRQLKDPEFRDLLERIYRSKMPFRSAKRMLEIVKEFEKELDAANLLSDKLKAEHMEPSKEKPGIWLPKEGAEHTKAVEDYLNSIVEIQKPRLTAQELFHFELSASDVELLQGIIDGE
jgi:Zn-dependent M32 family carboxypeptidase